MSRVGRMAAHLERFSMSGHFFLLHLSSPCVALSPTLSTKGRYTKKPQVLDLGHCFFSCLAPLNQYSLPPSAVSGAVGMLLVLAH